jgi:hypothetical protein
MLTANRNPPDPWPPPQAASVREWYDESGFVKAEFFRLLGNRTRWTSEPYTAPRVQVETSCRRPICVVGDSICGDIGARVKKLLVGPRGSCLWVHEENIGQLKSSHLERFVLHSSKGRNCGAYILCGMSLHWLVARVSADNRHNILRFHDQIALMEDPVQDHARYVKALLHNISALAVSWRPNAFQKGGGGVGGGGDEGAATSTGAHSTGDAGARLVGSSSNATARPVTGPGGAASAAKPIILVGSGELDALTLLARPSKRDWRDFHQFALLSLWRQQERQIFSRGRSSFDGGSSPRTGAGHNDSIGVPSWAARGITYFDTQEVYARYPGVRCDGIHFASDFATFADVPAAEGSVVEASTASAANGSTRPPHACHGSPAVWDWYLLRALEAAGLYEQVAPGRWRERTVMA